MNDLTPQRLRVLRAVGQLGHAPVTLNELVSFLGGHPNTTRQHLTALTDEGFVEATSLPRAAAGRPPTGYSITIAGRRMVAANSSDEHRQILRATADFLSRSGATPEDAHEIGRTWASEVVDESDTPEEAWDTLIEVLDARGFAPVVTGDDEAVLTGCPLWDAASDYPHVICPIHQGMSEEVLTRLGRPGTVELLPSSHPDGCLLKFRDAER